MAAPKLMTRQALANSAAERWRATMPSVGDYYTRNGKRQSREETLREIEALGPTPNPDAVDAAIGNASWTVVPRCNGCGNESLAAVVQLGEQPDYESATACICPDCLKAAVALLEDA